MMPSRGVVIALLLAIVSIACASDEPRIGGRTVTHWLEAAQSPSREERVQAAHMLVEYHRAGHGILVSVLALLEHDDPEVRQTAIRILAELRRTSRALELRAEHILPVLIDTAQTLPRADQRKQTLDAIAALGPHAAPAVPALIDILERDDPHVAVSAASALANIGPDAQEAIPALLASLESADVYLRRAAGDALSIIGPAAVNPLRTPLASDDLSIHARAAESLGRMKPLPVDILSAWLNDPDPRIREGAARALGGGRPPRPVGVPALLRALEDDEPAIRRAALASLAGIPDVPAEAAAPIIAQMADEDQQIWSNAVRAAARIGPDAMEALTKALEDPDPRIRAGAAAALASLHRPSLRNPLPPAVQALLPLLADDDADVRYWAAEALAASSDVRELAQAARDDRPEVRRAAVFALGRRGDARRGQPREAVLAALTDPHPAVRIEALFALAAALDATHIQPKVSEEFKQALERMLDDPDPSVRSTAARILAQRDHPRDEELKALAASLAREYEILPYFGFEQDVKMMLDTVEWTEGVFAAPRATAAAARFARQAPLIGMKRQAVIDLLGEPGERRGWPEPPGHEESADSMMYRFTTGMAAIAFRLRFIEDIVVDVEAIPMR